MMLVAPHSANTSLAIIIIFFPHLESVRKPADHLIRFVIDEVDDRDSSFGISRTHLRD